MAGFYNTIQYNTIQYNTIRYNTMQDDDPNSTLESSNDIPTSTNNKKDLAKVLEEKVLSFIHVLCRPFEGDPQGSVHRMWGICLLSMTILFVAAVREAKVMHDTYGLEPISIAAIWTAIVQLFMGVVGTFVLRRFPTEFSVGFFLGLVLVIAQQNVILYATFSDVSFNTSEHKSSRPLAIWMLLTGILYMAFAAMLAHFRHHILLAPVDVKTVMSRMSQQQPSNNSESSRDKNEDSVIEMA